MHVVPMAIHLGQWLLPEAGHQPVAINHSFDLQDSAGFPHYMQAVNRSHVKCPNVPHNRDSDPHNLRLKTEMKAELTRKPMLQRAICALYALDYLCLAYDLPAACEQDVPRICAAVREPV